MKNVEITEVDSSNFIKNIEQVFCESKNTDVQLMWKQTGKCFFSSIICNAIDNLRKAIEDPRVPEINLKEPAIETSYPVQVQWSDFQSVFNHTDQTEQGGVSVALKNREEQLLSVLTGNRIMITSDDFEFAIEKDHLPIPSTEGNIKTPISFVTFTCKYKQNNAWNVCNGALSVTFHPLLVVTSKKEARFPVFVILQTIADTHKGMSNLQGSYLLSEILTKIRLKQNIVKENKSVLSKPKQPNAFKSPCHLEILKFGNNKKTSEQQIELLSNNEHSEVVVFGLDLNASQHIALHAIQKILANTNYKGNIKGRHLKKTTNAFKFEGYLPRLKFTQAEYLDAYGVNKYRTSRGKVEYSGGDSKTALDALRVLGKNQYLIVAKRVVFKCGKEEIDRYQTVSTVLRIYEEWEGLSSAEDKELDEGIASKIHEKHSGFIIEPCPLLVDQIDSYFVLRPANMYQELRLTYPNASKFAYLFIDWIIKEASYKRRKNRKKPAEIKRWPEFVEIGKESLAYALRMDAYIKKRDWKRINSALGRCYEIALGLGWISSHETYKGKIVNEIERFYINKKKFCQIDDDMLPSQEELAKH